jgi:hypothetical protein
MRGAPEKRCYSQSHLVKRTVKIVTSVLDEVTRATQTGRDLYLFRQLGHIIEGNLRLCGDNGLNLGRLAIRPQSADKFGWH